MAKSERHIGGLFEIQINPDRCIYGLCVDFIRGGEFEVSMGHLMHFFHGTFTQPRSDPEEILLSDVRFSGFINLNSFVHVKAAKRVASPEIPAELAGPIFFRNGCTPEMGEQPPRFVECVVTSFLNGKETLEDETRFSQDQIKYMSSESLYLLPGIEHQYKYDCLPKHEFCFYQGLVETYSPTEPVF